MSIEELALDSRRALVIGIGGGGDVIGCIPTARFLRRLGVEVLLGGLTWERKVVDPLPGPRRVEELEGVVEVCERACLATPETRTRHGTPLTESVVSACTGAEVLLLDVGGGVEGTKEALRCAMRKLEVDLVIGIDVGGDSLAMGDEKGVQSPLADSIMLLSIAELGAPAALGVIGYGSDGELTPDELNRNIAWLMGRGAFLGAVGAVPEDVEVMERIAERTATEASRLVVEAAKGKYGHCRIRKGSRRVFLTPMSVVTLYFLPEAVAEMSRIARIVRGTRSLEEADRLLRRHGYATELYYEERARGVEGEER